MQLLLILLTVLESFMTTMETKTLSADFTLTVTEGKNAPMTYPGSLTMQGAKFVIKAMGQEVAYDGLTLYSYSREMNELTLTEPREADLLESNPFLYARAIYKVCDVSERVASDGKTQIITLVPRQPQTGVGRFVLQIRDGLPISGEVVEGAKTTRVVLHNPQFIPSPASWVLTYPDAYVNDLR